MELQYDAGIHDPSHDIHVHNVLPSLDRLSLGGCSDETCEENDGASVRSENGDTDYDLDSEEEEEEEEEEDSGEDECQIHALIDDLEVKFRALVSSKISEAEQFFDDANALQRLITHSALLDKPVEASTSVVHVSYNDEGIEEGDLGSKERIKKFDELGSKDMCLDLKETSTQTDAITTASSIPLPVDAIPLKSEATVEPPEQARAEIGQLRDVRESLIVQRQHWAAHLKHAEDRNEDEAKKAECKVYEIEEAIEAVDTAIEFKNQVVLGQPRFKIVANDTTPGSNEAELVTRLESLSIEELRRLLCIYFAKVVELRSSSRRLEKQLEHAENTNDQLSRRVAREHKHLREMHTEYQTRIRMILSSNNPNSAVYSCFRRMDEQLAAAHKKQHDLERSLTELLVRHGYLVNGADYDVKQVVKMLGIESQLAGTANVNQDRDSRGHAAAAARQIPTATHSSRSVWQKVSRGTSSLGHRRNGRQLDGHELSRIHRDTRMVEGLERDHRQGTAAQPPAEVRREKRRLIIQQPASSAYSHHGGNGGHNNHYSHAPSHPSAHGSNFHPGYK